MASPYRPTARSWERPTHRGVSSPQGSMYGNVHHHQAQQQQQQRHRELDQSSRGGYAEDGASLAQEHFYSPPHGGRDSSAASSPSRHHHGSFDPRSPAPLLVAEENRQLRRQQEDLLDRCRELEQQLAYARAPAANDSSPERVSRAVLRRSPSPRVRHTADGYDDDHAEGTSTPPRHRQRRDDDPDANRSAVVSDIALEQLRDLNGKLQQQQQDNVVLSKRVNELEELLLKSKASERDAVARAADASRAYLQARRGVAGGAMESSHTANDRTSDHRGDPHQPQQQPEPDSDVSPARDAAPPAPRRHEQRQHQQQPQRAPAQQLSGPSSPLPLLPQDAHAAEVAASPARAQESPPRDPFAAPPSTSTVFGGRPASPSPSRSGPAGAPPLQREPRLSKTPSVPATAPRKSPPAKLPLPNGSGTGQASSLQATAEPTAAAPSKLALPLPPAKTPAPATADNGAGGTPLGGAKKAMLPQPPASKLQPANGAGTAPSATSSSSGPMPAVMPSPPPALKHPCPPGAPAGGESPKLPPGPGGAEAPRGLPSPATVHAAVSVGRWSWGAWAKSPWLVVAVLVLYIAFGFGSGSGDGEVRSTGSRWAAPPPAPPSGAPPPLRGEGAEGASVSDGLAWLWWAWSAAKWLYNFIFGEVVV